MPQPRITIYDPPMCCPTGICGPDVDPELVRIAGDLKWLEDQGVTVERFNLAQQPDAFVGNPAVLQLLNAEETACLPLTVVDGAIIASGSYPSRADLVSMVGLSNANQS